MAPQTTHFGELTQASRIRRVGNVCVDRDEERAMQVLLEVLNPEPFGQLNLVRTVARH
ncbi:MAG: hypothetical protein AAFV19_16825 [Pseudomonadota bacterium]